MTIHFTIPEWLVGVLATLVALPVLVWLYAMFMIWGTFGSGYGLRRRVKAWLFQTNSVPAFAFKWAVGLAIGAVLARLMGWL